jgi:hypothetical protein
MQAQLIPQRLIEAKVAWASPIGPAYHTAAAKERARPVEIEMVLMCHCAANCSGDVYKEELQHDA